MTQTITTNLRWSTDDPRGLVADVNVDVPVILTSDHAAASHGQPVAVIDGVAYGPGDGPKPLYLEIPNHFSAEDRAAIDGWNRMVTDARKRAA